MAACNPGNANDRRRLRSLAYLVRIGYSGPREPSLATLRALVAAHTAAIPFENIDVFLRRGVRIDVPSVQRKLVAEKRGGYCFEQSTLFEAALAALGFAPIPLIARVVRGVPEGITTPRSHKNLLLLKLTEVPFLADVGFGNLSPTAPIALRSDEEQPTSHGYRLVRAGPEFVMQAGLAGRWESMYRFALEPAPHIDYEVGNWFTSTYPGSPFYGNLIVALGVARRPHHTLQPPSHGARSRRPHQPSRAVRHRRLRGQCCGASSVWLSTTTRLPR